MNLAISKVYKLDENGCEYEYYKIKKRFLFWYFDYDFKVYHDYYKFCTTYSHCNRFESFKDAHKAMCFLYRKDLVIKYRGYKIERVIKDAPIFSWAYVVTNKPYRETVENILYNFSEHIDVLKARIDRHYGKKHVETIINFTQ